MSKEKTEKFKRVEIEIKDDFIIKKDVKIEIVDDGKNIKLTHPDIFAKKITSSNFPTLLGTNPYSSKIKQYMNQLNLLEKSEIHKFWLDRGNVAERVAYEYIKDMFEKRFGSEKVEVILFHNKDYKFGDQWYYDKETKRGSRHFGGRLDIGVKVETPDGDVKKWVVEVKSKNADLYDTIHNDKKMPEYEVEQGKFLATMSYLNEVTMVYVFFTNEQEQKLLAWGKSDTLEFADKWTYKDFTFSTQRVEFDRNDVLRDMNVVSSNLRKFAKDKKIPFFMFDDNDLKKIYEHMEEYQKTQKEQDKLNKEIEDDINAGVDEFLSRSEDDVPF